MIILLGFTYRCGATLIHTNVNVFAAKRSDNFVVGLTNVSPLNSTPTLWNYTVCGQYPGAVADGATVSLYCSDNLPPFRYVIVQFPKFNYMNICELEVHVRGIMWRYICYSSSVYFTCLCLSVCLTHVQW